MPRGKIENSQLTPRFVLHRYCVTKQFAHESGQRSLLFQIEYPEIEDGKAPRHRFMSSIEQKIEPWDKRYQYLLFAADPYEVFVTASPLSRQISILFMPVSSGVVTVSKTNELWKCYRNQETGSFSLGLEAGSRASDSPFGAKTHERSGLTGDCVQGAQRGGGQNRHQVLHALGAGQEDVHAAGECRQTRETYTHISPSSTRPLHSLCIRPLQSTPCIYASPVHTPHIWSSARKSLPLTYESARGDRFTSKCRGRGCRDWGLHRCVWVGVIQAWRPGRCRRRAWVEGRRRP